MKIEYYKEDDVAYIYLKYPIKDGECKKTVRLNEDISLDYDSSGKLLGLEILNAKKVLSKQSINEAMPA